jgi:hypothetical protein
MDIGEEIRRIRVAPKKFEDTIPFLPHRKRDLEKTPERQEEKETEKVPA